MLEFLALMLSSAAFAFPERYLDNAKKGKNGKHKEWREYKEPKVLHVMVPAVAVKRPITRNL